MLRFVRGPVLVSLAALLTLAGVVLAVVSGPAALGIMAVLAGFLGGLLTAAGILALFLF